MFSKLRRLTIFGVVFCHLTMMSSNCFAISGSFTGSGIVNYQFGDFIVRAGAVTWQSSEPSCNQVEIFLMANNPDPSLGIIVEEVTAVNYIQTGYTGGGGTLTFSTDDLIALRSPLATLGDLYYLTGQPINASQGPYLINPPQRTPFYFFYSVIFISPNDPRREI